MGRPKTYGAREASELLAAAERIVAEEGLEALSVRRLATELGVTTRAVYSLYGSKDGLVVALGARAFHLLQDALEALPTTSDPAGDLVEAGALIFRRFALDHPALLRIGFLHAGMAPELASQFRDAADRALERLRGRFTRLAESGHLGSRSVAEAIWAFQALCEGLAALEQRCEWPADHAEWIWRDTFGALVAGWRAT
ncbi:MAG TPA: TetR/AcrR family transcriptional regulator [Ktedonobacterales bacterium]|jgi:AcrR family transcriptional regulator